MISRYRASLGGTQLDSLDDNLMILDIQYPPIKPDRQQVETAGQDGYEETNEKVPRRLVYVVFELHIYDIAKRNAACQKVNDWAAAGGKLVTNDRKDQYLNVSCEQFAEIQSAKKWTDPLTLVFSAHDVPYWISETPKTLTMTGSNNSGTIKMDGNTKEAKVQITATALAAVSSFQATVGDTQIKLTGLELATGQKLIIDYLKDRYLRVRANGKSVLAKMDPASSDLLLAPCGKTTAASFKASNRMTVVFSAKGMWR